MDFIDGLMVLRRRWWIVLIGLGLVAAGVMVVRSLVPVQHQASGLMLFLLPPDAPGDNTRVNPYLNLPAGLTTTASLIGSEAVSDDVAASLAAEGYDAVYSVALVPDTGPLLTITSTDTDSAVAVATRDAVMSWIDKRLVDIQVSVDAPRSQLMRTNKTSVTTTAEVLSGSRLRAMAGAAAGGLVLLLVAVFVIDRLLTRRQRRAARAEHEPGSGPSGPDDDPIRTAAVVDEDGADDAVQHHPVDAPAPEVVEHAPVTRPDAGTARPSSRPERSGRGKKQTRPRGGR
ncbi:hypothetical protein [Nocardioides sp. zg-1228]|uniref:hypothetical protein n=1 Tax=Nocardioides sp. zg-1228 TaxID=2763008 RepID=UPI0016433E96|nr:hypothetical protein [Nocardioides sp. zg-1228]MBC2931416.1 hypothetical protein [Nocardioides sp. zg-1228]QSF57032.1 hypothetical protein JX575_15840 [Nocardioides sp. zg-1228]